MASKCKTKKIVGIVVIVIGLVIFLLGLYAKSRVSEARSNAKSTSGMFGDNPVNKQISGAIENKIGSYDSPVFWTIVGGIIVMVIGASTVFCCRKKR
jgi:hypothetical protein